MKKSTYYLYLIYDLSVILGLFFGKYPFNSFVILFGLGLLFIGLPLYLSKYINNFKAFFFLSIYIILIVNGTLCYKYYFNEDYYKEREVFALTSGKEIKVVLQNYEDKFSYFVPEDYLKDKNIFYDEDNSIKIEVRNTSKDITAGEVNSYTTSLAYLYEEEKYKDVENDDNIVSYIKGDIFYKEYYMSFDSNLYTLIFSCPKEDKEEYITLFDLIILTIYYE